MLVGHLDAATATAEGRLDGNRQAVNLHKVENLGSTRNRVDGARGQRCANLLGDVTGRNLVAQAFDRLWARADPDQTTGNNGAGKVCVFGQEAVAGVNRVGT